MTRRVSPPSLDERVRRSSELFPRFLQRRSPDALKRTRLSCGDEDRWNILPGLIRTVQPQGLTRKEICALATKAALVDMSQPTRPIGKINYGQLNTLDDLFHSSYDEIDRYTIPHPLAGRDTGHDADAQITSVLCNGVFRSRIRGSYARTPWYREAESCPSISMIGLQQILMNVMCYQYNSKSGEQARLIFRPPFRGDFSLSPRSSTLQQVSVTSSKIGEYLVYFLCNLIRIALGIDSFYPTERVCHNCVVTVSLRPTTINLDRLQRLNPTIVEQRNIFEGRILKDPEFPRVKLLVFPTGAIIIVGSKDERTFRQAMAKHIPLIYAARTKPGDIAAIRRRNVRPANQKKPPSRFRKARGVNTRVVQGRKPAKKRKRVEGLDDEDIQISRPLKKGKTILGSQM